MGMSLQLSFEVGLLDVIVGIHGSVCERLVHVTEVGELESGGRDKVAAEDVLRKSPERWEGDESTTIADDHRLLLDGEERGLELGLTEVTAWNQ